MPGEFEPQDRVYMAWPQDPTLWRQKAVPAQQAFAEVAKVIASATPVTMACSKEEYVNARNMLPRNIDVVVIPADDAWMRDIGPTFVVNSDRTERRGVDWIFNSWGLLFDSPYSISASVAREVTTLEGDLRYPAPLVNEGGAIHSDGEGTLLTTEDVMLDPKRNPGLSKEDIEAVFRSCLGVEKTIWLPHGVYKDEVGGHIDNLVCFVKPGELLLNWTDDVSDEQYPISVEALEILSNETDAQGRKFTIHKLHQPGPLWSTEEETEDTVRDPDRLCASYINSFITNSMVVVPLMDEQWDQKAVDVLKGVFPDHSVVGVPGCREILLGGGNIHCIAQQVPSKASAAAAEPEPHAAGKHHHVHGHVPHAAGGPKHGGGFWRKKK